MSSQQALPAEIQHSAEIQHFPLFKLPPSAEGRAALLDSPDALEAYLADVKRRREASREERRRAYWQDAVPRLEAELNAAEQEGSAEIAAELRAVLHSFREALTGTVRGAAAAPEAPPTHAAAPIAPAESPPLAVQPAPPKAAPPPDEPLSPQLAEEAQADLAARTEELEDRISAFFDTGGETLPDDFRARALLCEGQALIYDPHAPKQGRQPLGHLLDDLAQETPWAGTYPLGGAMLGPQTWTRLAGLYDGCVIAAEAMDWYEQNEEHLTEAARIDMLNAVSAAQQRLYRRPESLIRRDDAVQELYRRVRAAGQKTAFIRALSPYADEEELTELAGRCAEVWTELQAEVAGAKAQAERQARKEAAVCAVTEWSEGREGRGLSADSLEADRAALCGLLDECLSAGVPSTNVKVRAAILDTAPVLLAGEAKYAKFLEAVQTERARRSLDAVAMEAPPPEVRDEDLDLLVHSVIEFTRGKKIVMLGGKSRPQVAQELQARLECDVSWLDSDSGDKFSKFASVIKKADMVLLLKNFASHEMFYASKDAMAEAGKHFIVLPSGYGVKQVLFQLGEYIARQKAAA